MGKSNPKTEHFLRPQVPRSLCRYLGPKIPFEYLDPLIFAKEQRFLGKDVLL